MSISTALSNALSGLSAASRSADVVASNLANAGTEGYARRDVVLGSDALSGGVKVESVARIVDQATLGDRRAADGDRALAQSQIDFLAKAAEAVGEPGSGMALSDLVADFERVLVDAAARPENGLLLDKGMDTAGRLAGGIRAASESIQAERTRADAAIADAVDQLNGDLAAVARLNKDIQRVVVTGDDASSLMDARQKTIDRISELVPVRELDRPNGAVALLSEGGLLLDGSPPELGFQQAPVVTAQKTVGSGLSTIAMDGRPVDMARPRHALSGGKLDGLFAARDQIGTQVQANLDAFARDLMTRLEAPAADPTRATGDPGLCSDAGIAFDPANEVGLAGRIAVNALADPGAGGEAWRLRDGLGAATQGPVGDASGLHRLIEALATKQPPASGGLGASARDAAGFAADLGSAIGTVRDGAEADLTRASARATTLAEDLAADGVDSDAEMQKLLVIEQAYAANARVVSTVQSMIDRLLEI